MGYYSTVTGEIAIIPPLSWKEIKDSPLLPHDEQRQDAKLALEESTVDTEDGTLIRRNAPRIVPATDDSYKAYDVVGAVQEIVNAFPGHTYTGYLQGEGEENDDMWRVYVKDGKAIEVKPEITWPEL